MSLQCKKNHTSSLSIAIWTDWICGLSWDPSFMVTEVAMTGRDTPQARPRACLERTNTYGTFLSSQSSGRWRMISSGSASAAITMNSAMPLFRVLVAGDEVNDQKIHQCQFRAKDIVSINACDTYKQQILQAKVWETETKYFWSLTLKDDWKRKYVTINHFFNRLSDLTSAILELTTWNWFVKDKQLSCFSRAGSL